MNGNNTTRIKVSIKNLPVGQTDWARLDSLSDDETEQLARSDNDALPTTLDSLQNFKHPVNVKAIRKKLALSQEEFAYTFHLPLVLLQKWEQQRLQPDPIADILLRVIAHNPELVKQALAGDHSHV